MQAPTLSTQLLNINLIYLDAYKVLKVLILFFPTPPPPLPGKSVEEIPNFRGKIQEWNSFEDLDTHLKAKTYDKNLKTTPS